MNNNITSALLSCKPDWEDKIIHLLNNNGWSAEWKKRDLYIWRNKDIHAIKNNLYLRPALKINKIWLGGKFRNESISISPLRLYFESDSSRLWIKQAEYKLLQGKKPLPTNKKLVIDQIEIIKQILDNDDAFSEIPPKHQYHPDNLLDQTRLIGRSGKSINIASDIWSGIASTGVAEYPEIATLFVVNDATYLNGKNILNEYILMLKTKWDKVTHAQSELQIKKIDLDKLYSRLNESDRPDLMPCSVFLIAISGHKGDPLPRKQKEVIETLEKYQIPFRLFSYENPQRDFSASVQCLSILSATGGKPFRLEFPYPEDFSKGALIGVDVGHDRVKRSSTVVSSLLEPDGNHVISLKREIPLNESISGGLVRSMLSLLKEEAEKILKRPIDRAIILRDGRIPTKSNHSDKECLKDYLEAMKVPTALVEVRKRGNPPLFIKDPVAKSAPPGGVYFPEDSSVRFITCYETVNTAGFPNTFKISLPPNSDTFNWGIDIYSSIVCGLCYSTSLGTKPHLPGPIYWADGIAKTSDTDNRFRGQNVKTFA